MTDRWEQISEIYHAALELEGSERSAFLEKCVQDKGVRKEVESLLENRDKADEILESHALEVIARKMAEEPRTSLVGREFGSYLVISQLGRGGMGEVYRARDQKLDRDVAIKVLPEEFAEDADRLARFQREAKLLASLNHPNIASIHGLEESDKIKFLVLELVEGEMLSERLIRGPIKEGESLEFAVQIAEALGAAHEKGVIHRDLKPGNIKVTPENKVKVLDFGLAKTFGDEMRTTDSSHSPVDTRSTSLPGLILGTAAYMSPEQARGQTVDKRTDIWSFGCVLYEMLTGHAAFSGKSAYDVLAAVVRSDPEWSSLPASLHWRLREVLERCLKKDARDRYHDILDVHLDIRKVQEDPRGVWAHPVTTVGFGAKWRMMIPWISTAVVLSAIVAGFAVWNLRPTPPTPSRPVIRFEYNLPKGRQFSNPLILAVSPDGSQFVYSTTKGLYLRSIGALDAKLISETDDNPRSPFFSPDGHWIGYFSETERQLKKVAVSGGPPVSLCAGNWVYGANWNADNTIVYGDLPTGLMRVSANGGTPELLVKGIIICPQLLPDGKSVLFTLSQRQPDKPGRIVVQSLQSGERKVLFEGGGSRYLPTGQLVYWSKDTLFAVPFDLHTLEAKGGPVSIVEGVRQWAISDSGTLAYIPATASATTSKRILVWVDREGKEEPIPAPPNAYRFPRISPDGTSAAFSVDIGGNIDIWIWDFIRKNLMRLTFDETAENYPLWTLDGQRIVFNSNRNEGAPDSIYWKAANGTGAVEPLGSIPERIVFPSSWSRDGKTLVLQEMTLNPMQTDIGLLSMEGDRQIIPLLAGKYYEDLPNISPDGRWMAYQSDESGRLEIYVRPFPDVKKGRWQVSASGGTSPLWSPDGRELFYRNRDAAMMVPVETDPVLKPGKPRVLFRGSYATEGLLRLRFSPWDISRDGKRFLMMKEAGATSEASASEIPRKIDLVVNWFEELKVNGAKLHTN